MCVCGVCSLMWINWSRMVRQCSKLQLRYRKSSTATTHTHTHTHTHVAIAIGRSCSILKLIYSMHDWKIAFTFAKVGLEPHPNTGA